MYIDISHTNKKYGVIYADPPWPQMKGGLRACRKMQRRDLDYPTMQLKEIEDLLASFLEHHTEEKHNVFVWTIDKYLHETETLMGNIGYTQHARIIWDKQNGVAPAFTLRFSHEYLIWFYKKRNMLMPDVGQRGRYTTVLRESATLHSKKPEVAYKMIEELFPCAEKIELFARKGRENWDCWGDEAPGKNELKEE